MGLMKRLASAFKNDTPPQITLTVNSTDGWNLQDIMTTSPSTAMKLSAVSRCVEVLGDSISKLPIFIIDRNTKEHLHHPLLPLLELRPNEAMSAPVFKKLMECNRNLRGNAYALIVRSQLNARPVELLPLPPDYVKPRLDESGRLWYLFTNPRTGEVRRINQYDVLHYKAYTDDGINGVSVLARASEVIGTARMVERYEGNFYKNGAQPTGALTLEGGLDKPAKDKVREEWSNIYGGVDNAFRTAILDMGMKYQPISINNKDAQFVESKEVTIRDIARFFGVPLYKLMEGKQAYNSNEQNSIEYVQGTIHPIINQCEKEDTYKLLFDSEIMRGTEIRRNMMAELRADMKARGDWYKIGREIGYFSVDDICDLEDTPHVPGGGTRNASLNYVPLENFQELSINRNAPKGEQTNEG